MFDDGGTHHRSHRAAVQISAARRGSESDLVLPWRMRLWNRAQQEYKSAKRSNLIGRARRRSGNLRQSPPWRLPPIPPTHHIRHCRSIRDYTGGNTMRGTIDALSRNVSECLQGVLQSLRWLDDETAILELQSFQRRLRRLHPTERLSQPGANPSMTDLWNHVPMAHGGDSAIGQPSSQLPTPSSSSRSGSLSPVPRRRSRRTLPRSDPARDRNTLAPGAHSHVRRSLRLAKRAGKSPTRRPQQRPRSDHAGIGKQKAKTKPRRRTRKD